MAEHSMTSATLYTGLTEAHYAAIIHESVAEALWATNVCKKFCRQEDISTQGSRAWQLNYWDANTAAAALTETQDLSNTALTLSSVTLTTAEVGAMTTLSDWLLETSVGADLRTVASYGTQLGKSISKKIDQDITALFIAFNSGTYAGTGSGDTDVTGAIATAQYTLESNNATAGDRTVTVLEARQVHELRKQLIAATAVLFTDQNSKSNVLKQDQNGYVGTYINTDIFQTENVDRNLGSARGAMLVPGEAIGYVQKRALRAFTTRDESLRSTEVGATLAYAVGELRDLAGICVNTQAKAGT